MHIGELIKEAYEVAKSKGWHTEPRSLGDYIALCHSELSEALEEYRCGHGVNEVYYAQPPYVKNRKPEGVAIELADVVIRIADMCGFYGIDLEEALRMKLEYNRTRPHRHGGKRL